MTHATWALERTAGMTARIGDDLVIADSGLACDTFNFICQARLDPATLRQTASDAVGYFERVERPFSWWVGPADRPRELGAVLESLGLVRAETEQAMALPLDGLPDAVPAVATLEIRRVRSPVDLGTLARLSAANWTPPDSNVVEFYRRTASTLLARDAPLWFYLGFLDGEPVATSEATVQYGTVGLYNIGTRPPFRGRGIGSAMTWKALQDARAAGCDLGVLQAAAAGVGLYRRLGFATFGDIAEYKPQ